MNDSYFLFMYVIFSFQKKTKNIMQRFLINTQKNTNDLLPTKSNEKNTYYSLPQAFSLTKN